MSLKQNDLFEESAREAILEVESAWLQHGVCRACGEPLREFESFLPDPVGKVYEDRCINPRCHKFGKEQI